MRCQFCRENVRNPCHNAQEMQQRAASHIERCEHALKSRHGLGHGAHARDIQGGGRH